MSEEAIRSVCGPKLLVRVSLFQSYGAEYPLLSLKVSQVFLVNCIRRILRLHLNLVLGLARRAS